MREKPAPAPPSRLPSSGLEVLSALAEQEGASWKLAHAFAEVQTEAGDPESIARLFDRLEQLLKIHPPASSKVGRLLLLLAATTNPASPRALAILEPYLDDRNLNRFCFMGLAQKPRAGLRPLEGNQDYWHSWFEHLSSYSSGGTVPPDYQISLCYVEDENVISEKRIAEMQYGHSPWHHTLAVVPLPPGPLRERFLALWVRDALGEDIDTSAVLYFEPVAEKDPELGPDDFEKRVRKDWPSDALETAARISANPTAGKDARDRAIGVLLDQVDMGDISAGDLDALPEFDLVFALRKALQAEALPQKRLRLLEALGHTMPEAESEALVIEELSRTPNHAEVRPGLIQLLRYHSDANLRFCQEEFAANPSARCGLLKHIDWTYSKDRKPDPRLMGIARAAFQDSDPAVRREALFVVFRSMEAPRAFVEEHPDLVQEMTRLTREDPDDLIRTSAREALRRLDMETRADLDVP